MASVFAKPVAVPFLAATGMDLYIALEKTYKEIRVFA
jgi:hypothetical protein